ncbi:MAG: serine hydrolase domain-containing protein [Microthrixaceae bacterium]
MRSPSRFPLSACAVALVLLAGCTGSGDDESGDAESTTTAPATTTTEVVPGDDWQQTDVEQAGLDPAVLDELAAAAEAAGSTCLVVTRDGELVQEWYWNGGTPDGPREAYSVSKSVTSALVGIASDDGDLSVEDPASETITEWVGTPSESVTIEHLLSNDSGRHHDLATDYVEMAMRSPDKTTFSIELGQDAPPGTTWAYNNAAIQTLDRVISTATGQDTADFAAERLFAPLGMADSSIRRDASDNSLTFMGVQSTCRDLARFGTLMLRGGRWGDEQIVSEEWVEASTGASSQDMNAAYGWLWWLNRPGPVLGAVQASGGEGVEPREQLVPGAPDDMFFALGFGGQTIAVDPGSRTVVTRMGPAGSITEQASGDGPEFGAEQAAIVAIDGVRDGGERKGD